MARLLREYHRNRLDIDHRLAAESAADFRRVDLQVAELHADELRRQVAYDEMPLTRTPELALAVRVVSREARMRLDIGLVNRGRAVFLLGDLVSLGEAGVHVADREAELFGDIGRLGRRRLDAAGDHVLEQQRRILRHRVIDVDDMRQDLVIDVDQCDGLGRHRRAYGRHGRDRVAVVEHFFARHNVAGDVPEIDRDALGADIGEIMIRKVGAGHHRLDARQRLGLRRVDRPDTRMRVGAAQDLAVKRAGEAVVIAELGHARDLRHAVRTDLFGSDPFVRFLDLIHRQILSTQAPSPKFSWRVAGPGRKPTAAQRAVSDGGRWVQFVAAKSSAVGIQDTS
jgi:hypothetical protein